MKKGSYPNVDTRPTGARIGQIMIVMPAKSSHECFIKHVLKCKVPGGDERDRTAYLLHAMQALYQLSYTPIFEEPKL